MNDYKFGNYLYDLRTHAGLSQTDLALVLGVTNKAVSKWEMGASTPDLDKIIISYTTPNAVNTIVIDKLIMNSFLNSLTFINSLKASIPLYDKLSSLAISFTYST